MIQIASDRVNRPLYRAIVKTIADIAAWLSKHSLCIFLIGSKGLFIWSRASPGTRPDPLWRDLAFTENSTALLMFYFVFI